MGGRQEDGKTIKVTGFDNTLEGDFFHLLGGEFLKLFGR